MSVSVVVYGWYDFHHPNQTPNVYLSTNSSSSTFLLHRLPPTYLRELLGASDDDAGVADVGDDGDPDGGGDGGEKQKRRRGADEGHSGSGAGRKGRLWKRKKIRKWGG